MRIYLLLAAFVACLASTAWYLQAQGQPGVPPANSQRGTNVAVIDVGFIFKNATRFKMAMDDLKQDDEKFQTEMTQRRDAITAQIEQLQRMQKGSTDYRIMEEQIAGDQTKLKLDVARQQKNRIEREAKIYYNAYREIEDHVREFAGRRGIDLVLRFNSEAMDPTKPESVLNGINRFVVFQDRLNITNAILTQMNRGTPDPVSRQPNRQQFVPPGGTRRQ